ncbi:MAG: hypothetical protein ABF811_08020 [Pseudoclavibacter sp.]
MNMTSGTSRKVIDAYPLSLLKPNEDSHRHIVEDQKPAFISFAIDGETATMAVPGMQCCDL